MSRPSTEREVNASLPFVEASEGVRVRVRVSPRARATRIEGLEHEPQGGVRLRVAVTEAADAGRANAAVLALLAKVWRLPKTSLAIASGATDRRKTVLIAGDGKNVMARLLRWGQTQGWQAGD